MIWPCLFSTSSLSVMHIRSVRQVVAGMRFVLRKDVRHSQSICVKDTNN